jgi:peptide/nickel transport system substrate-binding protein
MTRRPRRLSLLSLGATAILVFAACGGGATATPTAAPAATPVPATPVPATPVPATTAAETPAAASGSPAASAPAESPAASASTGPAATPAGTPYPSPIAQPPAPAEGMTVYPDPSYGTVTCATDTTPGSFNGLPYGGNLKLITATDSHTVEFDFCNPDVAFLSQIAFQALAIDDAGYLIANMGTTAGSGAILNTPNGTGPYELATWDKGTRMDFKAFDGYWGPKALTPNLEFQWSDQAAARLVALQAGSVDGIDNPGKGDIATIQGDSTLKFYPREGTNTLYLGMNNTDSPWTNLKVRQAVAQAIDRKNIVDNFYPPGSSVADFFVPCSIPDACKGDKYWDYDPSAAKTLFQQGMQELGVDPATFSTKLSFRAAVRPYLPDPPTIAQEVANELQTNLGITVTLDLQDSGTFLDNNAAGKLDGLFLLGWGMDFPDASNFMDYHFGPGSGAKFGKPFPDLVAAITKAGRTPVDATREADYTKANNLIKADVPAVIIAHGGSGAAYKATVKNAVAAPLEEQFAFMQAPGDTLTFMQNAEPLSLYCGDETDGETLRACNQVKESLYAYEPGGSGTHPALAKKCTSNKDLTVWTCDLQTGVKFQQGQDFGPDDVILSFAAQWDTLNKLHVGRSGAFEYWDSLIGQGKLNPAGPCGLANTPACTP